jgi:redox-sensitive bicupin YhaK (pirin superfamily)
MPRNRRSPGLLRSTARTAGRTALIAGTATATSNAVHNRSSQRANQKLAAQPQQADVMVLPMSGGVATTSTDLVAQLAQLAQLKDAGALSEAEFEQAKAKLLN